MKKERPINYNSEMVKAILDNRKLHTRRTRGLEEINKNPDKWILNNYDKNLSLAIFQRKDNLQEFKYIKCSYGKIGDRLWVKETWAESATDEVIYRADEEINNFIYIDLDDEPRKWKPSIFMFRKYSRINLEITNIRVERLQDIMAKDCLKEGIVLKKPYVYADLKVIADFKNLWDSINKKRYPWSSNPWVFVIEFKRIK